MSLLSDLGPLRPETDEQRDKGAKVGEAAKSESRSHHEDMTATGRLLDKGGNVMLFPAKDGREMLEAIKP